MGGVAKINWGDLPTWVAAVGTVGAVIVALVLSGREGRRQIRAQRRHQAELVTGWLSGNSRSSSETQQMLRRVDLQNASSQLVYHVIISLVITRGAGTIQREYGTEYRTFLGELPPGKRSTEIEHGDGGMMMRFGIELAFRDAAGRSWLRDADGLLKEIPNDPAVYYGLSEPVPWQ